MQTGFDSTTLLFNGTGAVFYVDTVERGRVYMTARYQRSCDAHRRIVFVDAQQFLTLWKQKPHCHELDWVVSDAAAWRLEKRYTIAEREFSAGKDRPVPLAYSVCGRYSQDVVHKFKRWRFGKELVHTESRETIYTDLINGVITTVWLMANGADAFPVEVDARQASLLYDEAGCGEPPHPLSWYLGNHNTPAEPTMGSSLYSY